MKFWVVWKSERSRWVLTYKADDGNRRQKAVPDALARDGSAAGKRAVEAWAAKELAKPAASVPEWVEPTMRELVAKFLEYVAQDERVEKATRDAYTCHLTQWVLPFVHEGQSFAELTLPAVDVSYACAFVRHVRKRRAPQTTRNILSSLAKMITVVRAQKNWTRVDRNVAQDDAVRSELPELEHREVEVLSHMAVDALLHGSRAGTSSGSREPTGEVYDGKGHLQSGGFEVPLLWRLRYALGALAGLEDGVVAGLRIGDIDRDDSGYTLLIRRAVKTCGADGWASPGTTKNKYRGTEKAPRRVPVHPALAALLNEWLAEGWELWTGKGRGPNADDWLLPRPDGEAWRPRSAEMLREHLAKLGIRAQVGALEYKQLRAWFATELEATGATDATRKRLMGHRGSSTAARHYTAEQRDLDRAAVERIRIGGHLGRVENLDGRRGSLRSERRRGSSDDSSRDVWSGCGRDWSVETGAGSVADGCRRGQGTEGNQDARRVDRDDNAGETRLRRVDELVACGVGNEEGVSDGMSAHGDDTSNDRSCKQGSEVVDHGRFLQTTPDVGCSGAGAGHCKRLGALVSRHGACGMSVPDCVPTAGTAAHDCSNSSSHLRDLNSRPTVYEFGVGVPHQCAQRNARLPRPRVPVQINGSDDVNGTNLTGSCASRVPEGVRGFVDLKRSLWSASDGWDVMESAVEAMG